MTTPTPKAPKPGKPTGLAKKLMAAIAADPTLAERIVKALQPTGKVPTKAPSDEKPEETEEKPEEETEEDKPEAGSETCPVCGSKVAEFDARAVGAGANPAEIDAIRAERAASQSGQTGDYQNALAAKDLAKRVREDGAVEPQEGDDTCPACSTPNVTVNEQKLSPAGLTILRRKRSEASGEQIDAARERASSRIGQRK